jgi:hypothetical protein
MAAEEAAMSSPASSSLASSSVSLSSPIRALEAFLADANKHVTLDEAPFWTEVAAFNQMPQTKIDQFYGQYVAVYGGNIVDADHDEAELALRFYRTFGYVPVYIHKVGTEEGLVDMEEDQ